MMKRHVMVGRFGAGDRVKVDRAGDEVHTRLELLNGAKRIDHGIGAAIESLAAHGVQPTEIGVDLAILAAHVHAADTRISRWTESQDSWTREIRLIVPVSDPQRWNGAAVPLVRALNFLTGDRWVVGFRARPRAHEYLTAAAAPLTRPVFDGVSLFSGGLDSLIGAIDEFHVGKAPLLVSHAGEGATSAAQEELFNALKAHYKTSAVERLRVWMAFPRGLVKNVPAEDTTRGRSFLFFALGVFAGTGLRKPFVLRVPENGLIAVNVPLDRLRVGALSTRTTHPFYIARWNDFLQALGIDAYIENPFWDRTKGEMAAACLNQSLLRRLAPSSWSCASPTKARWIGRSTEHCGHCVPCLIRRAALQAAFGVNGDATPYTVMDLRAAPLDTRQACGKQVRSFQFAIQRLRAKPALAAVLVHKPGPLTDEPERTKALAEVYRRGLFEVDGLLKGVTTRPL